MIDDFFQKKSPHSSSTGISKFWSSLLFRSLFYTSILGFITGLVFGYLHMRGWVPNANEGLMLYAVTFGIGALLSTAFVTYQSRLNQRKLEKVKLPR